MKRQSSLQFSGENATWGISKQQIFSASEGMVAHFSTMAPIQKSRCNNARRLPNIVALVIVYS